MTLVVAPTGGWPSPWPVVVELVDVLPADSWMLVGGLMVQLHARAGGLDVVRPTDDVDALIDVMASRQGVERAVGAMTGIGFAVQEPGWGKDAPAHRLVRGDDIVDVLVADHLPSGRRPRMAQHDVMAIDGGAQALMRRQVVTIEHEGRTVELAIPDLFGALVLKGAAYQADRRDRDRHLQDAAVLAALLADHKPTFTGSDKKRIRHLANELSDPLHEAWIALPPGSQLDGQETLRILSG